MLGHPPAEASFWRAAVTRHAMVTRETLLFLPLPWKEKIAASPEVIWQGLWLPDHRGREGSEDLPMGSHPNRQKALMSSGKLVLSPNPIWRED